jgi:pyrroloquinoline quinone biosynthesis protein B
MMRNILIFLGVFMGLEGASAAGSGPYVVVLGVAQDAGHPQAGCAKACCAKAWKDPSLGHRVASLGIVDPDTGDRWIIDATPDLPAQLRVLDELAPRASNPASLPISHPPSKSAALSGVLLTHGHIGHYTGLMHLGREVMGARGVPVHAMARMAEFLQRHGPWEQLVRLGNISLSPLQDGQEITLGARVRVKPIAVPHRDEYTETVGFIIAGPRRKVLYLPDIDKWDRWKTPIEEVIAQVDRAYLDGTFYAEGEIVGRAMSEIPHPFVVETMARLKTLPAAERAKVHLIHFNHTNPLLQPSGPAVSAVQAAGLSIAQEGDRLEL